MKIKVNLIKSDLENGIRQCPGRCPFANAIKRALKDPCLETINVYHKYCFIKIDGETKHLYAKLPEKITSAIKKIDACIRVNPMSFTLKFKYWEG